MTKTKLFDRLKLQACLRNIITDWPQDGYEIIQQALEKEIHYDEYCKAQRSQHRVLDNGVCRTQPSE